MSCLPLPDRSRELVDKIVHRSRVIDYGNTAVGTSRSQRQGMVQQHVRHHDPSLVLGGGCNRFGLGHIYNAPDARPEIWWRMPVRASLSDILGYAFLQSVM